MNCMKCGRDIPAEQVFCDSCLEVMEKYPVHPHTAIHLPSKKAQAAPKKSGARKRQMSPEEQVLILKKRCRRLSFTMVVLVLLLIAAATTVFLTLTEDPGSMPIGGNHTADTTPQE